MNIQLLLVSAISLLYRESQQVGHTNNSAEDVLKVVDEAKAPDVSLGRDIKDRTTEVLLGLKETAYYMACQPYDHQYEPNELLQRLKMNCGDDDITYEALQGGIMPELSESALKRTCINLRNQIRNYFRSKDVERIITEAFSKIKFNKSKINSMPTYVMETMEKLAPYTSNHMEKDPAVVDEVDFDKPEEVANVFQAVKEGEEGSTILRLGLQGMNRMLDGGYRRGEAVISPAALAHNFKTGGNLTEFRQIAVYNTPVLRDPTKKPLLLRISFEDSLKENFQFIYEQFYMNDHRDDVIKALPDLNSKTKEELADYIMPRMQATGFKVRMMRVNPSEWTYLDVQNKVLAMEAEGYEVIALFVDYLAMLPTTGCIMTTAGSDIRDMFRRIRNFCAPRHILFVTPHQLSSDAKKLVREGTANLVRTLPGKGMYDGSQRLDQEVDLEVFQHIEYVNGKAYLTRQRGKHRKTRQTPMIDRYAAWQMQEVGNLLDDVDGPDTTLRKPGAGPIGSARENPVWDFNGSDMMM
jgi:hypothetical protein